MAICDSGYYNKVTKICGEHTVVKRLYHSFEAAHEFLLEGANIALMRYFALRRFRGTVKTDTVLMGGEICESIYVSSYLLLITSDSVKCRVCNSVTVFSLD